MDLDNSILLSYISIMLRIQKEESKQLEHYDIEKEVIIQKLRKSKAKLEPIVMEIVDKVLSDIEIYADIARARDEDTKPRGL